MLPKVLKVVVEIYYIFMGDLFIISIYCVIYIQIWFVGFFV